MEFVANMVALNSTPATPNGTLLRVVVRSTSLSTRQPESRSSVLIGIQVDRKGLHQHRLRDEEGPI